MEIELGNKEVYIDFNRFSHILMVGSNGTGKTRIIENIIAQVCDTDKNARVIYLSNNRQDFRTIEYICDGSLINTTFNMTENSLISLLSAIYKQKEFRTNLLHDTDMNNLPDVDCLTNCYFINGKKYMPDETVSYFVNGNEIFVLAKDYYAITGNIVKTKKTKYYPTRTYLIIDCLDINEYSKEFNSKYWNALDQVCRFGRSRWQSLIFSSRNIFNDNMPMSVRANTLVKIMFDGDKKTQYFLFGKEVKPVNGKFIINISDAFGEVSI